MACSLRQATDFRLLLFQAPFAYCSYCARLSLSYPCLQVMIVQIPPGATGLVQPLDVYAFRIWKNYIRHVEDFIILNNIDLSLSQRNNALKLVALTHDQLKSPRYVSMFRYAWFKAGLLTERPEKFVNPVVFAFRDNDILCDTCEGIRMARCSWCKKALCVKHFYVDVHMCEKYVP